MDAGKAAVIGAAVGGSFSFLALLANIPIQRLLLSWTANHERRKELLLRRLTALRDCVHLVDFLMGCRGANVLGSGLTVDHDVWVRVRKENASNGAFLPPELQEAFAVVIRDCVSLDRPEQFDQRPSFARLAELRQGCVAYIEKEFSGQ